MKQNVCRLPVYGRYREGRVFPVKNLWSYAVSLLVAGLVAVLPSCNIAPSLDDGDQMNVGLKSGGGVSMFSLPATVSLDKVELYLSTGNAVTGNVTVEVREENGTSVVGSVTLPANSLIIGNAWNTFVFPSALTLNRDSTYRIYITRSDAHNYGANNYIFWRCSPASSPNPYPAGINDVFPSWNIDYAFKTFTEGALDQQQTMTGYAFFVGNSFHRWQQFKADYPKVTLAYVDLNLTVGNAATGLVIVQIRNHDGTVTLAETNIPASSLSPGTTWRKFKFPVLLYRDQPYRIYVTRTAAHNYPAGNYIFWRCSSASTPNPYPDGINDVFPSWNIDYAFKSFSPLMVDQQQPLNSYAFFTSDTFFRWQEFVPRN